jgi:hypothetical protein
MNGASHCSPCGRIEAMNASVTPTFAGVPGMGCDTPLEQIGMGFL